jgi:hypothetical protein
MPFTRNMMARSVRTKAELRSLAQMDQYVPAEALMEAPPDTVEDMEYEGEYQCEYDEIVKIEESEDDFQVKTELVDADLLQWPCTEAFVAKGHQDRNYS